MLIEMDGTEGHRRPMDEKQQSNDVIKHLTFHEIMAHVA